MSLLKEFHKTRNLLGRHRPPHGDGSTVLRVARLTVAYPGGLALDNVSCTLKRGEQVAVVGPNGAGKSTLFKVIAGVLRPSYGTIQLFDSEPDTHICIAYIPQRSQVDWNFPVTVFDVVMMGRTGKIGLFRRPSADDRQIVSDALDMVNLTHLAHRQIGELSGGQQQRMFLARALAQEAELMLMDEPLTGLDIKSQEDIFRVLDKLRRRQVTILVALHDLQLAADRFDRVMLLNHQLLGFGPPAEVFTRERLVQAYGGHLQLLTSGDTLLAVADTCCDHGEHGHG